MILEFNTKYANVKGDNELKKPTIRRGIGKESENGSVSGNGKKAKGQVLKSFWRRRAVLHRHSGPLLMIEDLVNYSEKACGQGPAQCTNDFPISGPRVGTSPHVKAITHDSLLKNPCLKASYKIPTPSLSLLRPTFLI
jgi:hypothetical protein